MNANATTTTNGARLSDTIIESTASTDYIRYAQNSFLTELPGIVFGFVTLAYLVSSLLSLA